LHHRDPFDRLIIAQSMAEQIPILSVDAIFDACAIARLW
jgi:PIN domain nuclease of toxin-antitoxin system